MKWLRQWRRERHAANIAIDPHHLDKAWQELECMRRLAPCDQASLYRLCNLFVQEKTFHGSDGFQVDDTVRARIGLLACLPILHLDLDWYLGWSSILVYADVFVVDTEELDDDGLVHRGRDIRSGEAWPQGPVILSWGDVLDSGRGSGYNLVVHELAHKLDMRNGEANGRPPLHRDMDGAAWQAAFAGAFKQLHDALDADQDPPLDPYAAEHPAECFAVFSEYFFDAPHELFAHFPAVYQQLRLFYRQDPAGRA